MTFSLLSPLLLLLVSGAASADTGVMPWLSIQPSLPLTNSPEKHWAVLVAGSNTWSNYRHQADACHAYQILRKNGIPAEQIITMMYDDIANNTENPTPGVVVNHLNGSDVYKGVKIDYRGREVTPENFLKVLKGVGDGRVLKSGPNDHVFINFVDHGAPGLVAFPASVLKAKQLIEALNYMHDNKMYKKMVIYVEACESGSMFNQLLPRNISIYATTAANPDESSYACYYDKSRRTYLGDVYSVNWMEDSDKQNIKVETLNRQFQIVKEKTTESHVTMYGDTTMGSLPVGDFQGNTAGEAGTDGNSDAAADAVSQRDAHMAILQHQLADASTDEEKQLVEKQLQHLQMIRTRVASVFDDIIRFSLPSTSANVKELLGLIRYQITNFDCHHQAVDAVHHSCFNLGQTEEALRHVYKLVNLCESHVGIRRILRAVRLACPTRRL